MIVVKVELHSAVTREVTELGRMTISNDGSSEDGRVGHYNGEVMRKPDFRAVTRVGRVENHRRLDKVIWVLVCRMLKNMGYEA